MGQVIRHGVDKGVGLEAEGAAHAAGSTVAGGEYVDVSVANHHGFRRGDYAAVEGGGFSNETLEAVRIGFFGVEAVAAIVLEEETRKAKVGADITGRVDRFISENGHKDVGMCGADGFERLEDARVDVGVIELMNSVIVEEKRKCFGYILLIVGVAFGVADGAANKHGDTVSDIAGDHGMRESRFAEVGEGGINGVTEIDTRVDEGAVEIEDEETGGWRVRHCLRVIDAGR
jgi:hypothetical protein